jgi:hypothetical protein
VIETSLLWKAWPTGSLMRRGVSTVGGYLCWGNYYWTNPVDAGAPGHALADFFGDVPGNRLHDAGLLLPRVSPDDPATWACLLADLAGAVERRAEYRFAAERGLVFNLHPTLTNRAVLEGWGAKFEWEILPTRDVALALVLCRIFEREHEASNPTIR